MSHKSLPTILAAFLMAAPLSSFAQARSCSADQPIGISGSNFLPVVAYNPTLDTAQILTSFNFGPSDEIVATSAGVDGVFGTTDDKTAQLTNATTIVGSKYAVAHDKGTLVFRTAAGELGRVSSGSDQSFGTLDDGAAVSFAAMGAGQGEVAIRDNLIGFVSTTIRVVGGVLHQVRTVHGCDLTLPAAANGSCNPGKVIGFKLPPSLNGFNIDRIVPERLGGTNAVISVSLSNLTSATQFITTLGLQVPSGAIVSVGAADVQVFGADSINGSRLTRKFITSPFAFPTLQTLLESRTAQGVSTPLHSGNIRIEAVGTEQDAYHAQIPYVYSYNLGGSFDTYMYDLANQHAPIQIADGASLSDISVGGPFVAFVTQNQRVMVRRCR